MSSFKFEGKGFAFFKIHFVNVILATLSLTLLYPWAKVRELKYFCQNLYLADNSFLFTGNVATYFKGFLKTLLVFLIFFLISFSGGLLMAHLQGSVLLPAIYTLTYITAIAFAYFFIPIILHGSLNYRLDNTSWGDIRPSYRGKMSELVSLLFSGYILTTLTAGIYKAWLEVKLFRYILQNLRFGSLRFDFSGNGKSLFFLYLKGGLLTVATLGIYGIWFFKKIYEYHAVSYTHLTLPTN
jgi:uncharacterized membrane protein YjgN (DUF898 family)